MQINVTVREQRHIRGSTYRLFAVTFDMTSVGELVRLRAENKTDTDEFGDRLHGPQRLDL